MSFLSANRRLILFQNLTSDQSDFYCFFLYCITVSIERHLGEFSRSIFMLITAHAPSITKHRVWFLLLFVCLASVVFYGTFLYDNRISPRHQQHYHSQYPYIALIIDDRASEQVVRVVQNILQHIPIDWKVQMIIPKEHWSFYNTSALSSFIRSNRVFMTSLVFPRADFTGAEFINLLLTSASLWHQVQGEKILYFQFDSVVCSNSPYNLSQFLEYDFIGAPWRNGKCCNGGLSLRSRTKMIEMYESGRAPFPLHETNEDIWLMRHLASFSGRIAPAHIAQMFSVETVYHPRPWAVHKPNFDELGPANMKQFMRRLSWSQNNIFSLYVSYSLRLRSLAKSFV